VIHPARPRTTAARDGFTLVEVLSALTIFAIGFATIGAMIPTAVLLQKRTMDSMTGKHFGRSAEDIVRARGFDGDVLDDPSDSQRPGDGEVAKHWNAIYDGVTGASPPAGGTQWAQVDRSYGVYEGVAERNTFWVPLFFDADPGSQPSTNPMGEGRSWRVYVFVLRGRPNTDYSTGGDAYGNDPSYMPRIASQDNPGNPWQPPAGVRVGDRVLANDGIVYVVEETGSGPRVNFINTVAKVWYAQPNDNNTSTFVALHMLIDSADDPIIHYDGNQ